MKTKDFDKVFKCLDILTDKVKYIEMYTDLGFKELRIRRNKEGIFMWEIIMEDIILDESPELLEVK